MYIKAEMS